LRPCKETSFTTAVTRKGLTIGSGDWLDDRVKVDVAVARVDVALKLAGQELDLGIELGVCRDGDHVLEADDEASRFHSR